MALPGKKGKLVTLGSRKELDCLVQFINDELKEPAFEVKKAMLNEDDVKIQSNLGKVSLILIIIVAPHNKLLLILQNWANL